MKKAPPKKTQKHHQTARQSSRKNSAVTPPEALTFLEHVYELRSRLFWVVTSLIVASSLGYYIKDYLVEFILSPLQGEKLIYLTPGGGFSFIFTVCLYFGALLTIPVIVYHIYKFLQPVLGRASRAIVMLIVSLSGILALSGALFAYLVAIPAAITFLTTFAGDAVSPNLTAESYLSFIVAYMLGLAALFQLPLLLFIFDHVKPFPPGALLSSQRFVVVGAIIAAALITPTPDIINQLIVAGPIIAIYQLGAIVVFVRRKLRSRSRQLIDQSVQMNAQGPGVTPEYAVAAVFDAVTPVARVETVQATPVLAKATTPAAPRRSVDGFIGRSLQRTLAVPQRSAAMTSAQVQQQKTPTAVDVKLRRSVDGMSVV